MARAITLEKVENEAKTRKASSGVPECNRLQEWVDSLGALWSSVVVSTVMGIVLIGAMLLIKAIFPGFLAG